MNDIYKSTDGIKWKRVGNSTTSLNRWSRRSAFGIATMNENVYVIGLYQHILMIYGLVKMVNVKYGIQSNQYQNHFLIQLLIFNF